MRYFAELAYNGANYFGWQRQPRQIGVQEMLENAFSTILGRPFEIVGCGRTDTGVHARQYFFHFDYDGKYPKQFLRRINKYLPADIVIYRIFAVAPEAHARFDAYYRSYEYHLDFRKAPFDLQTTYYFPFADRLNPDLMQAAAGLLLKYDHFYPFCKSGSDAKTMRVEMKRAEWVMQENQQKMIFHIAANRFLRGMVRLVVGMCLNVGMGKVTVQQVQEALDKQSRLEKSTSAPPQGLFLSEVRYGFME